MLTVVIIAGLPKLRNNGDFQFFINTREKINNMEKEIQSNVKIKEEEIELGIDSEEAQFIANSLFIDTSPKNRSNEINKTDSFEDDSISDCSSQSDDPFSKRMKLKSQFGSGFGKSTSVNSDTVFKRDTDNQSILTDFSCPVEEPVDDQIVNNEEILDGSEIIDDDEFFSGDNDNTSDEDYVPEEDMSCSSNDDIIYDEPPLKRKVVRTQRKRKLPAKYISESTKKVAITSNSTNVMSITTSTSNSSQIMNLSGKYDIEFLSSKYFFSHSVLFDCLPYIKMIS